MTFDFSSIPSQNRSLQIFYFWLGLEKVAVRLKDAMEQVEGYKTS